MDHSIKNTNIAYRSWKYWHDEMLHAKGISIAVAYEIYQEVYEHKMYASWMNADPVSYHTFHEHLSTKMLQ